MHNSSFVFLYENKNSSFSMFFQKRPFVVLLLLTLSVVGSTRIFRRHQNSIKPSDVLSFFGLKAYVLNRFLISWLKTKKFLFMFLLLL